MEKAWSCYLGCLENNMLFGYHGGIYQPSLGYQNDQEALKKAIEKAEKKLDRLSAEIEELEGEIQDQVVRRPFLGIPRRTPV